MNTITKQQLEDLYVSQRLTYKEVAEKLNTTIPKISAAMKQHDVKARPAGGMKGKPCPPDAIAKISAAHKGKKFSEEHRKNISESKKGSKHPRWGKPFHHPKRYWVECPNGDTVSMRSRWEVAYAKWLGDRKWIYEPETFICHDGSAYTPDFYLEDTDEYVEVKGWLTLAHKEKMEKFLVSYPEKKVTLANKTYLESLGIDLKQDWISTKPVARCRLCEVDFHRVYPQQFLCSIKCRNRYVALNRERTPHGSR